MGHGRRLGRHREPGHLPRLLVGARTHRVRRLRCALGRERSGHRRARRPRDHQCPRPWQHRLRLDRLGLRRHPDVARHRHPRRRRGRLGEGLGCPPHLDPSIRPERHRRCLHRVGFRARRSAQPVLAQRARRPPPGRHHERRHLGWELRVVCPGSPRDRRRTDRGRQCRRHG